MPPHGMLQPSGALRRSTRDRKAPIQYKPHSQEVITSSGRSKRKAIDPRKIVPKGKLWYRQEQTPLFGPPDQKPENEAATPPVDPEAVVPKTSEAEFIAVANNIIERNSERPGSKSWALLDQNNFGLESIRSGESGLVNIEKASFNTMTTVLIKESRRRWNKLRFAPRALYDRQAVRQAENIYQMWRDVKRVGPHWKPKPLKKRKTNEEETAPSTKAQTGAPSTHNEIATVDNRNQQQGNEKTEQAADIQERGDEKNAEEVESVIAEGTEANLVC